MTDVTAENCLEVVALCVIVAMFNMGISVHRFGDDGVEGQGNIFGAVLALRSGWLLIRRTMSPHTPLPVLQDYFGSLVKEPQPRLLDNETREALAGLELTRRSLQSKTNPQNSCLLQALDLLRGIFIHFTTEPKGWIAIVAWPSNVSDEYLEMLRTNQEAAVVIFIYWCALVSKAPKSWFLDGWARAVTQYHLRRLEEGWLNTLGWARSGLFC